MTHLPLLADLQPSAPAYLTGEVPSGKYPPRDNLIAGAPEKVWMRMVHLEPPQWCCCRGNQCLMRRKLVPGIKSVWTAPLQEPQLVSGKLPFFPPHSVIRHPNYVV